MEINPHWVSRAAVFAALLASGASASAQLLFSDNFDADTRSLYTITSDADTAATFVFNYSALGIPSAPNSTGGSTIGLKLEANNGDTTAAAAALSLSPTGKSFTGDFVLRFDAWMNINGPFPGGGTGGTQFMTAGVGTAGSTVHKATAGAADGTWFAVDGEAGAVADYRIYLNETVQPDGSGYYTAGTGDSGNPYYSGFFIGQPAPLLQQQIYPNQTGSLANGAIGFAWRDVVIAKTGADVTWSIDGLLIGTVTNANFSGNNVFVGYWDPFVSISDNPPVTFGLIDNLRVNGVPEPSSAALVGIAAVGLLGMRRREC